jgi:DNA-binding PadR family transcriptional regulator
MRRDIVRGNLPALALAVLSKQLLHGCSIAREVKLLIDEALTLKDVNLYPALRVLEQDGLIVVERQSQAVHPGWKGIILMRNEVIDGVSL